MRAYWITFEDGSQACCEGQSAYDAVDIAEKISGKKVKIPEGKNKWADGAIDSIAKVLPYPSSPTIWQFDHPVIGKIPHFCHSPKECVGKNSCPQSRSCDD